LNNMATGIVYQQDLFVGRAGRTARTWTLAIGSALLLFLCWLIAKPFLPAVCWAFALAIVAQPFHQRLCRKVSRCNLAAAISVIVIAVVLVAPAILLTRVVVVEATEIAQQFASEEQRASLRSGIESNHRLRPVLDWLGSRVDLQQEVASAARGLAGWISSLASIAVTGSIWFVTQIVIMMYLLFYFLRDGPLLLSTVASVLPLSQSDSRRILARIGETIRLSLYGKLLIGCIQGSLGGLMFWWIGLPTPVLWGFLMVLISPFPLLGTFVVWCPAAIVLALQGEWVRALILTVWGFFVIHPVDNFLGPIIVGTALRLHTLLMFFAVLGGVVAFGASGIVLGPVIVAVVVALFEIQQSRLSTNPPGDPLLLTTP
jgi:predicted PurR-regulated permease PerM